jgi:hypothetical protein
VFHKLKSLAGKRKELVLTDVGAGIINEIETKNEETGRFNLI